MHPANGPLPVAPRPDAATVVFVRPSSYAAAIHPTIFDERGTFLGDSEPSSHFIVNVPPGDHTFIVWAENTGPIRAHLLAGRVYFVEVSMKPGAFQARAHLLAIAPDTHQWPNLREWMADTKPIVADFQAGQAYLNDRRDEVIERVRRANEAFAEMDEDERNDRTLRANDGIAQPL